MSHHYFARAWACHAPTTVGYEMDGRFFPVAECSGHGYTSVQAEEMAASIVAALNEIDGARADLAQANEARAFITAAFHEAQAIAAAAQSSGERLRALAAQLRTSLQLTTNMLSAARLIMSDAEARRMAGEAVTTAREIIKAAS